MAIRNMGLHHDLEQLKEIGQRAKSKANYHLFSLKYELRIKIIDLGIRKKVRQYRRSWAGTNYFIRLPSCQQNLDCIGQGTIVQENNINIALIVKEHCRKVIDYKCATIKCCSVVNKTADLRWNLLNIIWMCVLSQKLGSRKVMIPQQSNCVQMATPQCPYPQKEELEETLQLWTSVTLH